MESIYYTSTSQQTVMHNLYMLFVLHILCLLLYAAFSFCVRAKADKLHDFPSCTCHKSIHGSCFSFFWGEVEVGQV